PALILSLATAATSGVAATTMLWPIAATGSLPVCSSSKLMLLQAAETVMLFWSNCMLSPPLSLTVQLGAAWTMPAAPSRTRARRVLWTFIAYFSVGIQDFFDLPP